MYRFRTVQSSDFPTLARWFKEPHVAEWWDDSEQDGLEEVKAAMSDPATEPFIVLYGGTPIGYQQVYDPHAEEGHPYRDQPKGTLGIDQFIGESDFVGRGHGSAFIREFVDGLFAKGAPRVVTDPNPRNARAIRAYEKAGFVQFDRRNTIYGDALMMARDRESG